MVKNILSLNVIIMLSSCASIQLNQTSARVIASRNPAPKGCKFLGSVIGSQGNWFSGGFTSNKNLAEGAFNDMKNKASALGANYVQLETNQAGVTGSGSSYGSMGWSGGQMFGSSHSQQTDVTNVGNAYYCNPEDIGLN